MQQTIRVFGTPASQLACLRSSGVDHGRNPVEAFVDDEGGWPLRCCLTDSVPGDRLAIVAWSPFPWRGPYAEVGPIVVHADGCDAVVRDEIPSQFRDRAQIVRPYTHDRRIAYDAIRAAPDDGPLDGLVRDALAVDGVDFVLVRNVRSGCYSFTVGRG